MDILDYATLKFIWWLFIGVLLIGFAIMDGYDMGVGSLLPFIGKFDDERRVIINSIGPHWEGNQTWLITAGGAIFAALPIVFATAFSGFYWAFLAVLWALFFRPVGFKYRSMIQNPLWRGTWDWLLFVGSFVPALIFGVALGNVLQGAPFYFDNSLRSFYEGSFWALLNPFALLCGVVSAAMLIFHGGLYLMHRTEGYLYERVKKTLPFSMGVMLLAFTAAGFWVAFGLDGYVITSTVDPNALPNPLNKTVEMASGAWMANYRLYPVTILAPGLVYAGMICAWLLAQNNRTLLAFVSSSVGIFGVIATFGVSMFPFILPSNLDAKSSLTVWDATSSHKTLFIMLIATVILLPTVIAYTSWAFHIMRGKVTEAYIRENEHSAY